MPTRGEGDGFVEFDRILGPQLGWSDQVVETEYRSVIELYRPRPTNVTARQAGIVEDFFVVEVPRFAGVMAERRPNATWKFTMRVTAVNRAARQADRAQGITTDDARVARRRPGCATVVGDGAAHHTAAQQTDDATAGVINQTRLAVALTVSARNLHHLETGAAVGRAGNGTVLEERGQR